MYLFIFYIIYVTAEIAVIIIKQLRSSSCEGQVIENKVHDDFENKRYVYLIEHMDKNGKRYLINSKLTNGGKKCVVGKRVRLIKFNFLGQVKVMEPLALCINPLIRILLIGIFILGFIFW